MSEDAWRKTSETRAILTTHNKKRQSNLNVPNNAIIF